MRAAANGKSVGGRARSISTSYAIPTRRVRSADLIVPHPELSKRVFWQQQLDELLSHVCSVPGSDQSQVRQSISTPPMSSIPSPRPLTTHDIMAKKGVEQIVSVTAYDALFGRLVDEAGVDLILVGDSLGNVIAGYDSTLPVTLDQMIYHAAAVRRGVSRALLTVDMPFLTYQIDVPRALENSGRVLQQTGAQAVKVEGGTPRIAAVVSAMVETGIPVMGHLGFTPQSVNTLGGYRVQGRDARSAAFG